MSIPKKGARRITVDATDYLWRVRKRPTYGQGALGHSLNLAVQLDSESASVLFIQLPQLHPGNWQGEPAEAVTPSEVENHIRRALASGWNPNSSSHFNVDLRDQHQ